METFAGFNAERIRSLLSPAALPLLQRLSVLEQVDSTNAFLMSLAPDAAYGHAVLAEQQTAGRGRRGRVWHSPPGGNIYLSLGWKLACDASVLPQLPLMAAVCAVRALERAGLHGAGIKWPNDILVAGRKLAGILVEVGGGTQGRRVVFGVGVNVGMPGGAEVAAIDQAWTDVRSHLAGQAADPQLRDRVAGCLLDELIAGLQRFAAEGFTPFEADWRRLDLLRDRAVAILQNGEVITGTAQGIGPSGALRVRSKDPAGGNRIAEFHSGDVSIRAV